MLKLIFLTSVILLAQVSLASSAPGPDDLKNQFNAQLGQTSPVPMPVQAWLKQHTVLFIDGLGSSNSDLAEYAGIFFKDFNYAPQNFFGFSPPWTDSAAQNADRIYTEIQWLKSHGLQKPLILIGQSMGGAEVFLMLLKHPELVSENVVDSLIVMQGPVGGTPLGEILKRMTELPSGSSTGWFFTYWMAQWMSHLGWLQGAESLSPGEMQPLVEGELNQLSLADTALISNITYFVTVCQNPSSPTYPMSSVEIASLGRTVFPAVSQVPPVLGYNSYDSYIASYGPSDDMVPLSEQSIAGFGLTFSPLYGSHGNYLNSTNKFTSTSTHAQVRAYLRALIMTVSLQ